MNRRINQRIRLSGFFAKRLKGNKVNQKISINKGLVLRLAGTFISLGLLFVLLSQQGWSQIGAAVLRIPLWRFGLALGLMLASRLAVAMRWHILLKSVGMKISLNDTLRITFSGLFASNFLPTTIGGDVIRLFGAMQLKLDGTLSAASLVVDRLTGMAGMAAALPFGLPQLMNSFVIQALQINALSQGFFVSTINSSKRLFVSLRHFLKGLIGALSGWFGKPISLFWALIATFMHMFFLFMTIDILLAGLDERMSFWLVGGLWSAVYFLTLIPISINGYGLQEVSLGVIFSQAGNIAIQSSLTLALLIRTLAMLASLPGALFIPQIMAYRHRVEKKYAP